MKILQDVLLLNFLILSQVVLKAHDSLYINEDRFNDFIKKYPYFDKTTYKNKVSTFDYYGSNYYNKDQTKYILDTLIKDNCNEYLPIIAFLTKAYQEYKGFYIHGL